MIHGLIPAAGLSSRMGRSKLDLLFRGKTLLETAIDNLLGGGCERVTVILGPQRGEWAERLTSKNVEAFTLERQTPDMRSTVEAGLARIESRFAATDREAFALCPADCPNIASKIVAELIAQFCAGPKTIVVPKFGNRRGHPVLIGWRHVSGIRGLLPQFGLNAYLDDFPGEVAEITVSEAGVLTDVDTPEEYQKLSAENGETCVSENPF